MLLPSQLTPRPLPRPNSVQRSPTFQTSTNLSISHHSDRWQQLSPNSLKAPPLPLQPIDMSDPKGDRSLANVDIRLFETGNLADATIVCADRTWKVHKVIVSSRCKWFETAFYGKFAVSTPSHGARDPKQSFACKADAKCGRRLCLARLCWKSRTRISSTSCFASSTPRVSPEMLTFLSLNISLSV